jgi:hypothetical protein
VKSETNDIAGAINLLKKVIKQTPMENTDKLEEIKKKLDELEKLKNNP